MKQIREWRWIILAGVLAALAALGGWLLFVRQGTSRGTAALVTVNGQEWAVFPLEEYTSDWSVSLASRGVPVHFTFSDGQIRFYNVDCPDKVCENAGWLSRENQTAVCMPNRTSVQIIKMSQLTSQQRELIVHPGELSQWEQQGNENLNKQVNDPAIPDYFPALTH